MEKITIHIKRVGSPDIPLPRYMSKLASGADLHADLPEPIILNPFERAIVPTGFCLEIPLGYEAQIRPRSGLAYKHGITILNSPGTIDADYRGEVKIVLINLSETPYEIQKGDRIAQLIICPVIQAELLERTELSETERSAGGFGHTGKV